MEEARAEDGGEKVKKKEGAGEEVEWWGG